MQRILFDASVYIQSLRLQDHDLIQTRTINPGTALWLSSVVLEELYAGSKRDSIRIVEKLERDFKTVVYNLCTTLPRMAKVLRVVRS